MGVAGLFDAGGRAGTAGSMTKTQPISDALGHKSVLDKQRAAIDKLRAQNEALKHDLLLENKFSVRPGDPYAQALINQLQDEGDNLARKVGKLWQDLTQPCRLLHGFTQTPLEMGFQGVDDSRRTVQVFMLQHGEPATSNGSRRLPQLQTPVTYCICPHRLCWKCARARCLTSSRSTPSSC
jgi:hypothetical protein